MILWEGRLVMLKQDEGRWVPVEYDIRCETQRITGHDAVTGDTGRAQRSGIYTDEHHYSQMITQGRS